MDRTATGFSAETISRTTNVMTGRRTRSKSSRVSQASRHAEYAAFAATLRDELAPEGPVETIYAERAIVAGWRLREAVESERTGVLDGLSIESGDLHGRLDDDRRRRSDRAERWLDRALGALAGLRGNRDFAWGRAATIDTTVPPIEDEAPSDQFPTFPTSVVDPAESDDLPMPRWQDRLVFDYSVSETSPVVKGTWVTVAQVVSLIVDGQSWVDILRSHPELTENDIRICLSFATEQESRGSCGRYLA